MHKSWVLIEVIESKGEKKILPLAGTSDQKCINRVLAAMKLYKEETIKAEKTDLTLIRQLVVDNTDYDANIQECLEPENKDKIATILSLVDLK